MVSSQEVDTACRALEHYHKIEADTAGRESPARWQPQGMLAGSGSGRRDQPHTPYWSQVDGGSGIQNLPGFSLGLGAGTCHFRKKRKYHRWTTTAPLIK